VVHGCIFRKVPYNFEMMMMVVMVMMAGLMLLLLLLLLLSHRVGSIQARSAARVQTLGYYSVVHVLLGPHKQRARKSRMTLS
jgi:hypothetical protein